MPSQFMLIGLLSSVKFHGVAWLIDHAGLLMAWVFNVALTLGLVFLASWAVVHVAPAAAGALPHTFCLRSSHARQSAHCAMEQTQGLRHASLRNLHGLQPVPLAPRITFALAMNSWHCHGTLHTGFLEFGRL